MGPVRSGVLLSKSWGSLLRAVLFKTVTAPGGRVTLRANVARALPGSQRESRTSEQAEGAPGAGVGKGGRQIEDTEQPE